MLNLVSGAVVFVATARELRSWSRVGSGCVVRRPRRGRSRPTDEGRKVLQGNSLAAFEESEDLDDDKNERQRLDDALALHAPLAVAYYYNARSPSSDGGF